MTNVDSTKSRSRANRSLTIQAAVGLVVASVVIVPVALAPVLSIADPNAIDLKSTLLPPGSPGHLMGTDSLGRDFLSRLLWGGRVSILIGVLAVVCTGIIGTTAGIAAGSSGGAVDAFVSRIIDAQLAIPALMFLLMLIAVLGQSMLTVILVIALASWPTAARLARGMTLVEREKLYVDASRAIGASTPRILVKHVLPNIGGQLIVVLMLSLAGAILLESSLSFLGLGVSRPNPTWGGILGDGRAYITTAWWLVVLPGLAISMVVLGVNLFGDALRAAVANEE